MPKSTFMRLSREKQMEIIDKAQNALLANAYDTPIAQLLQHMDMPIGTFYRYFENKEDLFLHMLSALRDETSEKDGADQEDTVLNPRFGDATLTHFTERHQRRNELFHMAPPEVLHKYFFGENRDRLMNRYRQQLGRLKYQGVLREDIDTELLAYMYATTLYNFEMYCREYGLTEDTTLMWQIKKYFYFSFFKYGILGKEE